MQQAAHPTASVRDNTQERTMVELRKRSFPGFGALDPLLECVNPGNGAGNMGKPVGSAHQHGFQCLRGRVGDIVKPAAGSTGDIGAYLAQVNRFTTAAWRLVFHDWVSVTSGFIGFQPGWYHPLDALIPDIFWFSKDYCGLIEEKKRPSRQIFVRPATLAVISDLFL
jgi:hypothetical protein